MVCQTDGAAQNCELYSLSDKMQQWERDKAESYNKSGGTLQGYDCKKCLNRGNYAIVPTGQNMRIKDCDCKPLRKTLHAAKATGAFDLMIKFKLEAFKAETSWQKTMLEKAENYITLGNKPWFFAGGQTGAGKTHICTCIFSSLVKEFGGGQYIVWPSESDKINKAGFANYDMAMDRIDELCATPVLYIDDLFKADDGSRPDRENIKLAFEIINTRYNKQLPTVISSE